MGETLTMALNSEGDCPVLRCIGSAEAQSLQAMRVAIDALHSAALEHRARQVIVDLRALEFASAACVLLLVHWVQRVEQLDEAARFKIVLRGDAREPWQQRSIPLLASTGRQVVVVIE